MTTTATTETKSAEGRRNAPEVKLGPGIHPHGAKSAHGNQASLRRHALGGADAAAQMRLWRL